MRRRLFAGAMLGILGSAPVHSANWEVGAPIVTYWCGPSLTDAAAAQMAEGGFNLVWCTETSLDVARRHGLRGQLQDGLLSPSSLANPDRLRKLDELIERVKGHPALYAYFITDEPGALEFPALGKLVAHLREQDPAHLAYINLFPTYASNKQLGTTGDVVTAYQAHLTQFVEIVKPALLSYDHYQFALKSDSDHYFLNLGLMRRAAAESGRPFLNIVQASTWAPATMRVPGSNEVRYLVYTTLAYGAQGISYYIYSCANHLGGFAMADGTPTPLYHAVSNYNREFAAIARELQPLCSLQLSHTALKEPGCEAPPGDSSFRINTSSQADATRGFLMGTFGSNARPSHVVVVNLDYKSPAVAEVTGPGRLESFVARGGHGEWSRPGPAPTRLELPPGGGQLLRVSR